MATDVEVEIDSIAAGGDGVARAEGLVVFVPRAAPGDRGLAAVDVRGRFARGRWTQLTRPSPDRVEPPCEHYSKDRCGGCQLQHLRYDAQLVAKRSIIRDAMQRIGRRTIEPPPVRPSDRPWRYRRKLTLALRRRDGAWIAGLHPYDGPARVFELRDCPITDERVIDVWREVMRASDYLPSARALRGAVRLLESSQASFVLEGATAWPGAGSFFDAIPSIASLWWIPEGGSRRRLFDRASEHTGDAGASASFVQVNPSVGDALRAYAVDRVMAHEPRTVVDAFAGTGDTAVALAERGVQVTAIELDRDAARVAGSRLPAGSKAVEGAVETHLGAHLPADVVLLNPPRAGADERVTAELSRRADTTRAIVYVSCNPATLARDVARLPEYRIASLVGFDMFPQTAHVETVCELVPEGA